MFSWYYSATLRGLEALLGRSTQWRPSYSPVQGRLLYVPESSLPYHISGYTTRTHAVIRALTAAGADVRVLTRPGYPWDRKDWLQQPSPLPDSIDDGGYRQAKSPVY